MASLAVLVRTAGPISSPVLPVFVFSIVSEQRGCPLFHRERVAWEMNSPVHRMWLKYLMQANRLPVMVMYCVGVVLAYFRTVETARRTYPVTNQYWPAF
ncbi:hypothetical protein HDV63DRAFT_361522 [Trichoderma sp. SZMC 28014]